MTDKPTTEELVEEARDCSGLDGGLRREHRDLLNSLATDLEAKEADCAALWEALEEVLKPNVAVGRLPAPQWIEDIARKALTAHPAGKEMLERVKALKIKCRGLCGDLELALDAATLGPLEIAAKYGPDASAEDFVAHGFEALTHAKELTKDYDPAADKYLILGEEK